MVLNLGTRLVVFIIQKQIQKVCVLLFSMENVTTVFFLAGSDCYDLFKTMQNCMQKYPTLYNKDLADDEDFSSMDSDKKDSPDKSSEKSDKKSS